MTTLINSPRHTQEQLMIDMALDKPMEDYALSSVFEIEDVLLMIQDLNTKIDFLKGLKKHRAEQMDYEIGSKENQIVKLRNIILNTMLKHEPKQKTLQFPSVGKVTRKASKDDWSIDDEQAVIQFFEAQGCKKDAIRVKESLDVKAAKSLIQNFDESGTSVPGVSKKEGRESVTITFEDPDKAPVENKTAVKSQPLAKTSRVALKNSIEELDALDV